MARTLIVSVDYPMPPDKGSKQRTMSFVSYFLRRGDVLDAMCYRQYSPPSPRGPFGQVHLLDVPAAPRGGLLGNIYEKLVKGRPSITAAYTDGLVGAIHEIIRKGNYDTIVCRDVVNAFPLLSLPLDLRSRVVMDFGDVITRAFYSVVHGSGRGMERLRRVVDRSTMVRYQRRCCSTFLTSTFCSAADRHALGLAVGKDRHFVVPNVAPPFELPAGYRLDGFSQRSRLLFVGALSYGPNADGISWFIDEIFPRMLEQHPDATFVVAGRAPSAALEAKCRSARNVELVPNPADVKPLYDSCGMVVVPLLNGGGTSIKLLEAGLARRPVLTTSVGIRGLDLVDRRDVLVFEDARSFLEAYRHCQESGRYRALAGSLLTRVQSQYSEQTFASALDRALSLGPARGAALAHDPIHMPREA